MEIETGAKEFVKFDPGVPPYILKLGRKTMEKLGLKDIKEGTIGYEAMKKKFKNSHLFKESEDITDGPYQAMVNNVTFRVKAMHEMRKLYKTDEIIPLGSHTLIIGKADWKDHAAKKYIDDIINLKDGKWTSVIFSFPMEFEMHKGESIGDVHWVGVELFKGTDGSDDIPAIIYDPAYSCPKGKRRLASSTWMDLDDSLYGLVLPIIMDSGVRKKMEWSTFDSNDLNEINALIKKHEIIPNPAIPSNLAQLAVLLDYFTQIDQPRSASVLDEMFKLAGNIQAFYPEFTACQISQSDYFCQSWSLYLVLSRMRGNSVHAIKQHISSKVQGITRPERGSVKKLPCPGLGASVADQMRIATEILLFARWLILKTTAAKDYWYKQTVDDDNGNEYSGEMLYAWIKEAAEMEQFGKQFLRDIAKERRASIGQDKALIAQFENLLLTPKKKSNTKSSGLLFW